MGVILNQIKEVAIAASSVAAFFVGGAAGVILSTVVEQVIKLAEFGFNILSEVLFIAQTAFEQFAREEAELATLISIYEIAKTRAEEIAGDITSFMGLVETSVPLLLQLIDAQFGWTNIDLGWIAGVIMQNGDNILTDAFEVAKAFAFGPCELADNSVAFAIEDVGDERVVGPWTAQGSKNGKPQYRALINREKVLLEWDSRGKTWGIWVKDTSFGRGWWFGWIGMGWRELYETSSNSDGFPTTGWRSLEGVLPLPYMVSATNGGV